MLSKAVVAAIRVDIPRDVYKFARGDNITLPCTFQSTLSKIDLNLILTYYHPAGVTDIKRKYEGRVAVDVKVNGASGKADLKLSSITLDDNKEFDCEVQIPSDDEGQSIDATRLTVLVAPSPPICRVQGKAEYGQNINITCYSEEGSPPLTYKWESQPLTVNGGVLRLYDISRETSGYYICTSSNSVSSATCSIPLAVFPRKDNLKAAFNCFYTCIIFVTNCNVHLCLFLSSCNPEAGMKVDSTAGLQTILNLFCEKDVTGVAPGNNTAMEGSDPKEGKGKSLSDRC
uniref:Ig-like domain-containing protein n=1 Tax=Cyprinodon variegatus TaxID=28743 RepID=A0A3Q2FQE2_CYPVA